jgi:hypothetical protein
MNHESTTTQTNAHSILCWKTIFTGLVIALLSYLTLTALGAGIGGFRAAHILETNENGTGLLTGEAIWISVSAVLALFLGSRFAVRVSLAQDRRVGSAHGIMIAALFFIILMYGTSNSFGSLSQLVSSGPVATGDAEQIARAVGDTGWIIFITCLLGTISAVIGGYEGAIGNLKKPLYLRETKIGA